MQLGNLEPPDFEWEKPIVAGDDDDLVAVVNVRAQRHFRQVLGSGLRSGRRGLGPRRSKSFRQIFRQNYARPEGGKITLDPKVGSQVTLPGVPRSPSDVTREPKL